ncbi:MAG: YifB family Mg chelatase-like AAA ATPase [Pseudomonadota bacterium]|nr:YifB family Mg chelatase-like AAA ATPase [Pseudomonadota bacterium]
MVAHVKTVAFEGIEVTPVDVQVQMVSGLPHFAIVGLPDKAVGESKERVRAAIHALGLALPAKRIIVNLAPADLLKEGSHFDLPIAIGLLMGMGVLPAEEMENYVMLGELSLDGALLPVNGVLPAAIHALEREAGLICPQGSGGEAAWSGLESILAPSSLLSLINHFKGTQVLSKPECEAREELRRFTDMREIRGQHVARRALEVAAAGGHNLLMVGPPGAGKSMLASCLPGILPPLDAKEILEASMVASIAGKLEGGQLSQHRPFRDPHHSSSMAAMVGGGKRALPGEISLAHHGVLFLDELPEFPRQVLESMRQPLETGRITVSRAEAHVTYPARFQLIAAMNPCRCGYLDDAQRACNKAPRCAVEYQSKISGPLFDRFDMAIDVPEVPTLDMLAQGSGESSERVASRVATARAIQKTRFASLGLPCRINAELYGDTLHDVAAPDAKGRQLLEQATEQLRLSMRGYTRVLRVARTIADLENSEAIGQPHIAEALSYRQMQFGRALEEV